MSTKYTHLNETDRIQLAVLSTEGYKPSEIAGRLNKHKSTIYRELGRNFKAPCYTGESAHLKAQSRCNKKPTLETDLSLQLSVIELLKKHYSPRQIEVTLKKMNKKTISHESIYQFIYSDYGRQLGLQKWLARKHKKRKVRVSNKIKKSPIPNRNPIKNRSIVINDRSEFGHWEGDLMIFSDTRTNFITLRERVSRLMLVIKNTSKHADVTAKNIVSKFRGTLSELMSSLTLDNGGEFAMHEYIAKKLDIQTFFCDPYSSWQKGAVEQGNGVVRVEFPRSTDVDSISQNLINNALRNINNRPMKLHDDLSPSEIFRKYAGDNLKGFVALQT